MLRTKDVLELGGLIVSGINRFLALVITDSKSNLLLCINYALYGNLGVFSLCVSGSGFALGYFRRGGGVKRGLLVSDTNADKLLGELAEFLKLGYGSGNGIVLSDSGNKHRNVGDGLGGLVARLVGMLIGEGNDYEIACLNLFALRRIDRVEVVLYILILHCVKNSLGNNILCVILKTCLNVRKILIASSLFHNHARVSDLILLSGASVVVCKIKIEHKVLAILLRGDIVSIEKHVCIIIRAFLSFGKIHVVGVEKASQDHVVNLLLSLCFFISEIAVFNSERLESRLEALDVNSRAFFELRL